jgi:hypothetical protein
MTSNQLMANKRASSEGIKQALTIGAAIAEIISVTICIASLINQDALLILAISLLVAISAITVYGLIRLDFFKRLSIGPILIIFLISVAVVVIAWSCLAGISINPIQVVITKPANDGNVTMRYLVQGTVNDPNSKIHVITHPLTVPKMWVQNPPVVGTDGSWQTDVYFGTDTLGIGDRYEVIALATNENFLITFATGNLLREGQILESLPRNTNRSNIVTVTRPK